MNEQCALCQFEPSRVLLHTKTALAISDGFPLSKGHSLVIPRRHAPSLFSLKPQEQHEIWALVARVRRLLFRHHHPDGFNVGLNDGPAAGQTVLHAHVHVIPRWEGDVSDPRGGVRWVIPQKAAYWKSSR